MRESVERRKGTARLWKQKQGQRTKQREKSEAAHRWWAVSGRLCLCVCVCTFICVCAVHTMHICGFYINVECMSALAFLCASMHVCVSVRVCALWAEERYCMCAELFFPDGTGKQTLQGWRSWHAHLVHSWHCPPPCFPLCTGGESTCCQPPKLIDWQAV